MVAAGLRKGAARILQQGAMPGRASTAAGTTARRRNGSADCAARPGAGSISNRRSGSRRRAAASQNYGRERGGQPDRLADTQLRVSYRADAGDAWVTAERGR
ncbi:MAG: hypothetical protein U1E33_02760 [Rhodospirillales bacterium]